MRFIAITLLLFSSGCGQSPDMTTDLCECFSLAAYAAVRDKMPRNVPPSDKCCGVCTNGKVKSGDGIAWVSCPCKDSCPCKQKAARK